MTPSRLIRSVFCALVLVAAVLLTPVAQANRGADPALGPRLARALAVPHVDQARTGALAVDLATGRVVFARNATRSLAPASTQKLALTYALLTTLGPAYRIETQVLGAGALEGSTWQGDLVLKGYGDPSLSRAHLRRLAARLRELGLQRVAGSVIGDESFFDARRTAAGWRASFYIEESPPLSALTVDRAVLGGRVSRNPALAAATIFRSLLTAAGIAVAGPARAGRTEPDVELAASSSRPLLHLLRAVNRDSDNFTSEILLKHLGAVHLGRGTTADGAAVVHRVLAASGVRLTGVRVVDGSGLSLLDRLTADALVAILRAAWEDPLLRGNFLASLAVAGKTGTLEHRLRRGPARGRVFAKTGTTSLASALAGYVGGRYAFAVLQNGPPLSTWWCRQAQDRFVTVLATQ